MKTSSFIKDKTKNLIDNSHILEQWTVGCSSMKTNDITIDGKRVTISKLANSLPFVVWKKLTKKKYPPDNSFKYIIVPEQKSKNGNFVEWHLHIILILTEKEFKYYRVYRKRLHNIIHSHCLKFFQRVEIQRSQCDKGFVDYALKHSSETFDIIKSNLL